jgi:hypothetical protein
LKLNSFGDIEDILVGKRQKQKDVNSKENTVSFEGSKRQNFAIC